jgi:CheY-like chemotaxis protein
MDTVRTHTALLVDDDAVSRKLNQQRLEGDGYNVAIASDRVGAVSSAKRSAPKVIFIHMAGGRAGSLPLIEALRSDDACRHIRIVVLPDQAVRARGDRKLHAVSRDLW